MKVYGLISCKDFLDENFRTPSKYLDGHETINKCF